MASVSKNAGEVPSDHQDNGELDEYFTDEVVNVICSPDLSKMKTSLLEEVLNQKKQELLANTDVSKLLLALQKQRQKERGDQQNWDQDKSTPEGTVRVIKDSKRTQNPTPLPIDLTNSVETVSQPSLMPAGIINAATEAEARVGSKGDPGVTDNPFAQSPSASESKPQSASHISVHPSVYVLNRQTATSSKTQAKPS